MSFHTNTTTPIMSSKTYDAIKQVAQYWLPAIGTLYFTLASIWGLPYGEQVVGTIVALDVFLGVVLGYSKSRYEKSDERFDGALNVDEFNESQPHALEFKQELSELSKQDTVTLKVNRLSH